KPPAPQPQTASALAEPALAPASIAPVPITAPPELAVVKAPTPPPPPLIDPLAVVHQLEAWMPEKIATYKLRGFIQDVGGDLVESVPGRIRVRFGGKNCAYEAPRDNSFSWFGLARKTSFIDMELHLHRPD